MHLGRRLLLAGTLLAIAAVPAGFAQTFKTAKSGEPTLIYEHKLMGGVPPGLKAPWPYIQQPAHGTVSAKTVSESIGGARALVLRYYYTSNKGYKGSDSAVVGVNMQMRMRDGKVRSFVFPDPAKITILVN